MTDSRVEQLRGLIEVLVRVVERHGGKVKRLVAQEEVAREVGLGISDITYVVTSAVADHRITASFRTDVLEIYNPE